MVNVLVLDIAEPFRIVVENRLNTISPYILLEQETWFEDEVPFLKSFLKPGMKMVDIGTNCGFYTLLAASLVGQAGHVWGFEPGLLPARLLKESLRLNGFDNVTLFEAAAGRQSGSTWFSDKEQSELSAVVPAGTANAREVRVESLDELHASGTLRGIDFIKIDAEGFEDQVILGGREFFASEDPLVMLEVTANDQEADLAPAELLRQAGYELYRYDSGAECLVPLVQGRLGDYLLNIFLCRPGRANSLRQAGLLASAADLQTAYAPADPALFIAYFATLPIVQSCSSLAQIAPGEDRDGYNTMCAEFLMSTDRGLSAAERAVRLARACDWIDRNFRDDVPFSMLLSFIRIWQAAGRRILIGGLLGVFSDGKMTVPIVAEHPFLVAARDWEAIPAHDGSFYPWLASMLAETHEVYRSFSSLYQSAGIRDAYDAMTKAGYLSQAIERRLALATLIRGLEQFPQPRFIGGAVARNRVIWREIAGHLANGKMTNMLDVGYELT